MKLELWKNERNMPRILLDIRRHLPIERTFCITGRLYQGYSGALINTKFFNLTLWIRRK